MGSERIRRNKRYFRFIVWLPLVVLVCSLAGCETLEKAAEDYSFEVTP